MMNSNSKTKPMKARERNIMSLIIPLLLLVITMLLTCCGKEYTPTKSSLQTVVDNSPLEKPLKNPGTSQSPDNDLKQLSKIAKSIALIKFSNGWKCSGFYGRKDQRFAYIHTARFCDERLFKPNLNLTAQVILGPQTRSNGNYKHFNTLNRCQFIKYNTSDNQLNAYNFATLKCPKTRFRIPNRLPRPIPLVKEGLNQLKGRYGWDNIDCSQYPTYCPDGVNKWNAKSQMVLMGVDIKLQSPRPANIFISRKWPIANRSALAKQLFKGEECRVYDKQFQYVTHGSMRYPKDPAKSFIGYLTFCSTPGMGSSGGVALMKFGGRYKAFGLIAGEWTAQSTDHQLDTVPYDHNILSAIPPWAR